MQLRTTPPHPDNAGEGCHVGNLLDGRQEAAGGATIAVGPQLVVQDAAQCAVHIKDAGNPHVGHEPRLDAVMVGAELGDEGRLLVVGRGGRAVGVTDDAVIIAMS